MGHKRRLRHLEQLAEGDMLTIPQKDGTVAKFPTSAGEEAFLNFIARMGAGVDAPPEHPLIEAARNSSEARWSESFFAASDDVTAPIEDLSED